MIKSTKKEPTKIDKAAAKLIKLRKKRIIVRNLSFKVSEDDLKQIFSKYGNVLDVKIPLKADGRKRGFAFVQFDSTNALVNSMKDLNYKPIHGRPIAIDYAIDKTQYQLKMQSVKMEKETVNDVDTTEIKQEVKSESEEEDDDDKADDDKNSVTSGTDESVDEKRANKFLKEFGMEEDAGSVSDDSEDSDDDNEISDNEAVSKESSAPKNQRNSGKKISQDVSEGKTVFIRNVSFSTTEEDLEELMEEYGECEYCLLCIDKLTEHPKGTAFVKFKEKDAAQKLVTDSEKDPGIFLDGRKLTCNYAMSREDITQKNDATKKPKDKRNLNLLKCSVIIPGSKEAEGVSQSDMAHRLQLEMFKKEKLKNTNFCVSDNRLIIHNLPETLKDGELRKLCKTAAGKGAVVTEARVMRNFRNIDAKGVPTSKGFGFVSFVRHEDALKALQHLNNNPNIFTFHKRPIVEFSIENKVALLSKERRKEKIQMRNKRRTEEKNERKAKANESGEMKMNSSLNTSVSSKEKKGKKRKKADKTQSKRKNKALKLQSNKPLEKQKSSPSQIVKKKEKKQLPQKSNQKTAINKEIRDSISTLANKYKNKLLNKLS
ncbi:RNA-binding protein 28-like [Uloborus diversus]|uniref:RNA-binding protein 28-like n=1 Tax=Uloborus diversus TaxID=327109 RepID=UPI00240A229B|nr:RNA-binding protein 28-like [Uloborus diversus]